MSSKLIADEILGERIKALEGWTDGEVCAWLLLGFSSGNFERIAISSDPSPPLQIEQIFRASPPALQATLKRGVTRALLEWTPAAFGYPVFGELARTAAHLRASESVALISHHLLSMAFHEPRAEDVEDACETAIAVLHGFVPLESLTPVFLHMYRSSHFERYAAHIFLGLCECSPERFAHYVPRFLQILKEHPGEFHVGHILREFERIVPEELVGEQLVDLIHDASAFVALVKDHTKIPLTPKPTPSQGTAQSHSSREREAQKIYDFHQQRMEEVGVEQHLQQTQTILRSLIH